MIFLSKEIRQAEQKEKERQELLRFYVVALQLSAKYAVDTPGRDAYVAELSRLYEGISRDSSHPYLEHSLAEFEGYLGEYCTSLKESIGQGISGSAREIRAVLALLKEASGTLESSNKRVGAELKEFTRQLEETLDCNDLRTIHEHLSQHVHRMKEWADALKEDSSVQLAALTSQLRSYEDRLREVENNAKTDPLTGIWNRREAERRLQESINRGTAFSLMVIDLNNFKAINDRHGHRCGDCVLQYVANRLKNSIRSRDLVGRWGGDEFIVLMEVANSVGERRSAELSRQLRGIASLDFEGQQSHVEISASVGWAAYQPGDTPTSLFHRADLDMYKERAYARLEGEKAGVYAL